MNKPSILNSTFLNFPLKVLSSVAKWSLIEPENLLLLSVKFSGLSRHSQQIIRWPRAQCFYTCKVNWCWYFSDLSEGHIPKYLEWKLKRDVKITWSAWDQGRWEEDRMDPGLGILIKIPPKLQVFKFSRCYNQDSDLERWGIWFHCVRSSPIYTNVLNWTTEHP